MTDHDPVPPPASPAAGEAEVEVLIKSITYGWRRLQGDLDAYAKTFARLEKEATLATPPASPAVAYHAFDTTPVSSHESGAGETQGAATPPAPATDDDPLTPEELAMIDKAWEIHKAAKPSENHTQISDMSRIPPMHEVYNFARSNPVTFAEIAKELIAPAFPYAWGRGVFSPSSPYGPAERDCEFVYGDDRPEGEGWFPLYRAPASATEPDDTHAFKNFHRMLCERFGYVHDERDWRRDQVSLMEWIAKQIATPPASPAEPSGIKQRLRDLEAEYDPYDHALPLGRVHGTATIGEFVTIVRIALGTLLHGDDLATPPAPATDEEVARMVRYRFDYQMEKHDVVLVPDSCGPWVRFREAADLLARVAQERDARDDEANKWNLKYIEEILLRQQAEQRAEAAEMALREIEDLGSDGTHTGERHVRCRAIARAALAGGKP